MSRLLYTRMAWTPVTFWSLFVVWVFVVCRLSSLSASDISFLPQFFEGFDKIVHAILFAVGSVFLTVALRRSVGWPRTVVFGTSVLILSFFGWGDEIHQLFVSGRSGGDFGDWFADFTGTTAGALLIVSWLQAAKPHAVWTSDECIKAIKEFTNCKRE